MDTQTIYVFGGLISITVLICFFCVVHAVFRILRFQKASVRLLLELALSNGVDPDTVEKINRMITNF